MRLKDKVAVITGASRGIGRAIALRFAEEGCDVVVCYRADSGAALETVRLVEACGRRAIALQADVTRRKEVRGLMAVAVDRMGRIDILVNNAGVNKVCAFDEITDEDWDWILDTNLKGPFICCQEAWEYLKAGGGRIINIASVAGQYHGPKTVHYAVSKAGLISLTAAVARYGAECGILVNAIAPGIIATDLTRDELRGPGGRAVVGLTLLKRPGELQDVTSAAVFLAGDDQNYVTGQVISVAGGAVLP
ncbi:MAG: SDR family NAD(P)-dependent oxidoreductase [Candidatus Krumholzibacteriia bacterium]